MFDPENVRRQFVDSYYGENDEVVLASDYDQLLALYRLQKNVSRSLLPQPGDPGTKENPLVSYTLK